MPRKPASREGAVKILREAAVAILGEPIGVVERRAQSFHCRANLGLVGRERRASGWCWRRAFPWHAALAAEGLRLPSRCTVLSTLVSAANQFSLHAARALPGGGAQQRGTPVADRRSRALRAAAAHRRRQGARRRHRRPARRDAGGRGAGVRLRLQGAPVLPEAHRAGRGAPRLARRAAHRPPDSRHLAGHLRLWPAAAGRARPGTACSTIRSANGAPSMPNSPGSRRCRCPMPRRRPASLPAPSAAARSAPSSPPMSRASISARSRSSAFWARAVALDVPILIHPVMSTPAPRAAKFALAQIAQYTFDTTLGVGSLMFSGVLDRFPALTPRAVAWRRRAALSHRPVRPDAPAHGPCGPGRRRG